MLKWISFTLLVASCSLAGAKPQPVKMKDATVEVYKHVSDSDLHIFRIDPPGHDPKVDKAPAIVLFFGGGWNGGSPTHLEPQGRYLAERGLVVFLPEYRTKSSHKTAPISCVNDGKSAIRWVRKNAARLGVDPEMIAAGGGSAGGHVAAAAGMCEGLEEEGEDLTISSRPGALVLFNPVYDNGPDGYGGDRVTEWFPAISPAHNITKDDPPTIVFLGTKDSLVPVATAEKFQADQKALGIRSDLHLYEGEPHGFFNLKVGQGKKQHFIDTVLKADQFLIDLGYLEGEPDKALLKSMAAKGKK
ncbi:MAG: alpha/beta hydrolase [Verrucomicrobiales bacterium]|nr:alpha/beta hydrolase [Verrucomicrobiales bacterium]